MRGENGDCPKEPELKWSYPIEVARNGKSQLTKPEQQSLDREQELKIGTQSSRRVRGAENERYRSFMNEVHPQWVPKWRTLGSYLKEA